MLKSCLVSVTAILFLLVALVVSNHANAEQSISDPAIHKPGRRSNLLSLSKRTRERHFRRQNVKPDWNYIVPPPAPLQPSGVSGRRVPSTSSSPPRSSRPAANSNSNPAISVASRSPGPSSSLSNQRNNVEADADEATPAKPKGISPIQIRPAILDLSMPFALACFALVLVLSFLIFRGSAAVSNDVRRILLTSSAPTHYKVPHS